MIENQVAEPARIGEKRRLALPLFSVVVWLFGGLLLAFIVVPMVRLASASSPSALGEAISDPSIRASIRLSLVDALITAIIATILGVPLAVILARSRSWPLALVQGLVDLPLAVPHSVVGIALLFVFGRRGWVGAPLGHFGVSFFGTQWGIIIGMLFVSAPFVVDTVRVTLEDIEPRVLQAARSLGASPWYSFRRITLPLASRGILSGLVLAYARSISEFGAVVILAYFPMTAPVKVYDLYLISGLDKSAGAAVLLLIVTLSTFLVFRAVASGQIGTGAGRVG